jgi:uncharacterized membrane protein
MHDHLNVADGLRSSMGARHLLGERVKIRGVYRWKLRERAGGRIIRAGEFENVVTTVGQNELLAAALQGSSYTVAGPYMGLISSVSYDALSTTISSGTYTSGTGAVSLTTAASHGLSPGDTFTLASVTGTGSYAALDGTFVAGSGTTGTTLDFTTVTGLTMTISGGDVTAAAPRIGDTMSSHGNWTEADSTNAPAYGSTRPTLSFNSPSGGSISTSSAASFTFTGSGTVEGAFVVFGSGASSSTGNTSGTLLSAGAFGTAQPVISGNVLSVSYSLSL